MPRVASPRVIVALALALGGILASSARAQDAATMSSEPQPTPRMRVGVVLLPRGAATPEIADSLTELLIAAIAARGDTEIVGKEEFQSALGRDDAGTLACIESDACLGRMGRELRVRELVAGTLHVDPAAPDTYRFELYRLDVESGSARGRIAREVDGGLSALLSALNSSVDELYVERLEPGAIVVTLRPPGASLALDDDALERAADGSFRASFVVPGEHRLTARAGGFVPWSRRVTVEPGTTLMLSVELTPRSVDVPMSPWTWALGVSTLALGVPAIGLGLASLGTPDTMASMREVRAFYDARTTEALAANVLFVAAGVALVGTVVSVVLDLFTDAGAASYATRRGVERARW
jgi:hypothetical protein